jgi:hypothetical protein
MATLGREPMRLHSLDEDLLDVWIALQDRERLADELSELEAQALRASAGRYFP